LPSDNQAEEADLADGRKRFHGVDAGDEFRMNIEGLGVVFSTYLLIFAAFSCELGMNFAELRHGDVLRPSLPRR
jgi:hypothetical protein